MNKKVENIFVDLNGTLIRTDLFLEAMLQFFKRNPFNIFIILFWLLRGRSYTKGRLAHLVDIDVEHLPYEQGLLEYLQEQKKLGKRLILATASHYKHAKQVADYLGIFDDIIATRSDINIKGHRKLEAILENNRGEEFVYAGNETADRPIWKRASAAIFVNAPTKDIRAAEATQKVEKVIKSRPPIWRPLLRELRPHQYAKTS